MGGIGPFLSATLDAFNRISVGTSSTFFFIEAIAQLIIKVLILFAEKIAVFVVAAVYRWLRLGADTD